MKRIITALMLVGSVNASAVEGETYIKTAPKDAISKLEAMRELLTSNNKAQVYKCVLVELSKKGTVKNK